MQVGVSATDWPVPTLSISIDPNPVVKGRSTTVRWQSGFAKQVIIDQLGQVDVSGSKQINVADSFTLAGTAEGPGGIKTTEVRVEARQLVSIQIPRNQDVWIRLVHALGTAVSHVEEGFDAVLQRDLQSGHTKIATEGAKVWGRVTRVDAPGRTRGRAAIELTLEKIELIDGSSVAIETNSERRDKSSLAKDVFRVLAGAGAGAALGASFNGGAGVAKGTAAGAAAGVAVDLSEPGDDVVLPAGTEIKFRTSRQVAAEILQMP